jgi:Arm DNA-binding domain/Phage integrase central domain
LRASITKRAVDALAIGQSIADSQVRGLIARRLRSGIVTYGFRYWNKAKNARRWISIGLHGQITPDQARNIARKYAGAIADNRDPLVERTAARAEALREARAKSVQDVLEEFLVRYASKNALRSIHQIESNFKRHVYPAIGDRPIREIRRSEIVEMLDRVEDSVSPRLADKVLAHVRRAFNWYSTREELFNSPIVRGMVRTKPTEHARARRLSDDEIRQLWSVLDDFQPKVYAEILRVLLLTGQRLNEVARLR